MQTSLSINTMHGTLLLAVAGIFFLAGFVKGVVGLGLPTIAVGLLGIFMSPWQAAVLLILPSLVTNIWQLLSGASCWYLLRRLAVMLLGIVIGTLLGARFFPGVTDNRATVALGLTLMIYAGMGLAAVRFFVPPAREQGVALLIGLATGMITAATAVFVIPAVPFLQALRLDKDELIQALGLSFTASTIAMAAVLVQDGGMRIIDTGLPLLSLLPALGGMFCGQSLRARISERIFRRCFLFGLLLLGLHLAVHGWRAGAILAAHA